MENIPDNNVLRMIVDELPKSSFVNALDFQNAIYQSLRLRGYKAIKEFKVRYGRIDIVVGTLGIELDNKSPRIRSVKKLKDMPLGGYVIMRDSGVITRIFHESH
jgi:hypothetical protein